MWASFWRPSARDSCSIPKKRARASIPPSRRRPRRPSRKREARMTAEDAMERINTILTHAWMVRAFLKHADEVQGDEELLEVHRMIYDYIAAVEPSYQRQDAAEYLR